jgi:RNA polymerase sigma factor (sigma-70 family)
MRWELMEDAQLDASFEEQFVAQRVMERLSADGVEIGEIVGRAVAALPPLQREVLILAEYDECSLDEIARAVDANVGTVKSRLHRARENLRRLLAPLRAAGALRE